MGGAALTAATFVDPEALVDFFDALRVAGYGISTDQYIAAQDLVLALAAHGAGAGDAERLKRMLGPLVSSNARQQDEFGEHFDRWARRLLPARDGESHGTLPSPEPLDPPTGDDRFTQELEAIARRSRWFRWRLRPLAVALAVALGGLYVWLRPTEGTILVHSSPDRAVVRCVARIGVSGTASGTGTNADTLPCVSGDSSITVAPGDSLGVTPLELRWPAGDYTLALSSEGYRDAIVQVLVSPRDTSEVDVSLARLGTGQLRIRTRPGAAFVLIDTQSTFVVRTPSAAGEWFVRDAVIEGAHQVRLRLPEHRLIDTTLFVIPEDTASLDVSLARVTYARLRVGSVPPGATVLLDGARVGVTPLDTELEEGPHVVRLQLAGYRDTTLSLAEVGSATVVLQPLVALRVTSEPPGATVSVDGVEIGTTPVTAHVTTDSHDVRVAIDAYETFTTRTRIDSADSLRVLLDPIRRVMRRAAFLADGRLIVGSPEGRIQLAEGGRRGAPLVDYAPGPESRVLSQDTAYSADSSIVALPGPENSVILRGVNSSSVNTLRPHDEHVERVGPVFSKESVATEEAHVSSVALTSTGDVLAAGDALGRLRLWSTVPQPEHTIELGVDTTGGWRALARRFGLGAAAPTSADDVAIAGDVLATWGAANGARLWSIRSGAPINVVRPGGATDSPVALDSGGTRVVPSDAPLADSLLHWLDSLSVALRRASAAGATATPQLSSDGRWRLTTRADSVTVQSTDSGARRVVLPHDDAVTFAEVSANGAHVVTRSGNTIRIWNVNGVTELADLAAHRREVNTIAFSPDGRHVATGGGDSLAILWDARTRESIDAVRHPEEVEGVAFSPDGRTLAVVGPDSIQYLTTPDPRWSAVAAFLAANWSIVLALAVLFLSWLAYRLYLRRRAMAFVRRQSGEPPHLDRVVLKGARTELFPRVRALRLSTRLRRRHRQPSDELDVIGTVHATLRQGGVFTPAFRQLQVTPHYLALVDRTTLGDQQAALIDDLLDTLRNDEVLITRYYFDGDPRVCFPADRRDKPVSLSILTQRYPMHRLLLFGEARRFFHPVTGEREGWTDDLKHWSSRVLLTPEVRDGWGWSEAAVAREFPVHHASALGVAEFALGVTAGTVGLGVGESDPGAPGGAYPRLLQQRPARWIERSSPPEEDVVEMLGQLEPYLGPEGMSWLAACAVYPALSWRLTLNLGHALTAERGESELRADELMRLARLPWFRHATIPDWMRLRLLDHLTPAQERSVRRTLEGLLLTALQGDEQSFDLEVASRHATTVHSLTGPILRLMRRSAPPSAPIRDYVFAEFMSGWRRQRLVVLVKGMLPAFGGRVRGGVARDAGAVAGPRTSSAVDATLGEFARVARSFAAIVRLWRAQGALGRATIWAGFATLLFVAGSLGRSWQQNQALTGRVDDLSRQVRALPDLAAPPGTISFPSIAAVGALESLRSMLDTLQHYSTPGVPARLGWGRWRVEELLSDGRGAWLEGYMRQLHTPTFSALEDSLHSLPAAPGPTDEYATSYNLLKAYLIMTSESARSTPEFLAPVLMKSWPRGQDVDSDLAELARRQFEYYAERLASENPFPQEADAALVARTRAFLGQFSGAESIYQQLMARVDAAVPAAKTSDVAPAAPGIVAAHGEMSGAFTSEGWAFVQRAFESADFSGEQWVVGDQLAASTLGMNVVVAQLRARYRSEYIEMWRAFVRMITVTRPAGVQDAARMVGVIGGAQSPLLGVLSMVSRNTSVDSSVGVVFQPVHVVVSPDARRTYVNADNQAYLQGLEAVQRALVEISSLPPATDTASVMALVQRAQDALGQTAAARQAARRLAQKFAVDASAVQLGGAVAALLEAPIDGAEKVLRGLQVTVVPWPIERGGMLTAAAPDAASPAAVAGGKLTAMLVDRGRAICSAMTAMLAKFPFNPAATEDATVAEVAGLLAPGTGQLPAFQQGPFAGLLEKQGGRWVGNTAGPVALSPSFVAFFNKAMQVSEALFSGGSSPRVRFLAKGEVSNESPVIALVHGTQLARFTVNTPQAEFIWPSTTGREARLRAQFDGGPEQDVVRETGEWAIFRLIARAAKAEGSGGSLRAEWNTTGQGARPVAVQFTIESGAPVFQRGWLGGMSCTSQITQ
ncbi:MAG: PEGA domain-containing protein [Gemmatimonadetes bacterium]|nr:PEGA domain-containing protein [Gemmatimonadota bacterium]